MLHYLVWNSYHCNFVLKLHFSTSQFSQQNSCLDLAQNHISNHENVVAVCLPKLFDYFHFPLLKHVSLNTKNLMNFLISPLELKMSTFYGSFCSSLISLFPPNTYFSVGNKRNLLGHFRTSSPAKVRGSMNL